MHKSPKVSVIIPSYNYGHTVKLAVNSVLSQNIDDIEIIIINDCSTDNTHDIVQTIDDKRIVYIINETNLGVNSTVNIGFKNAKGKFLCVLAADDMFPPDSLKSRIEILENNELDAVHGGTTIMQDDTKSYVRPLNTNLSSSIVSFLKNGSDTHGINNATFMYNRRVFEIIGYRNETSQYFPHNDFEFALRTLLHCNVAFLDYPLYVYNLHPNSHSDIHAKNIVAEKKHRLLKHEYIQYFQNKAVYNNEKSLPRS